jgi:hypothetical protein
MVCASPSANDEAIPMNLTANFVFALCTAALTAQNPAWSSLSVTPQLFAVAWDAARNHLVIVGPSASQRLWEWDGVEVRERLLAMQNQPKVLQLVYDARLQQVVALGEGTQPGYYVGTWRGAGWTWRNSGGAPAVDPSTAIAFDHVRGRLVLYRGLAAGSTVHEWDGQQWWLVSSNQGPASRTGAAFAFDPIGHRCVLYGGSAGNVALADAWSWDGFAWGQIAAAAPPGPRSEAALAFDPFVNRLVLYGGAGAGVDTWQLVGAQWTQVPTANDPGPQRRARLFADDQGLMLVGGSREQAGFEYDPAGTLWRLVGSQWQIGGHLPNPTPLNNVSPAYDHVRRQVVVFSGNPTSTFPYPDRTQLFDRRWRFTSPVHQPAWRHTGRLCWSAPNQAVLLFGGGDGAGGALDDTWTWNGSDWQQQTSAQRPAARWGHVLAEDPLGGVLLFGGFSGSVYHGDSWRWNGTSWQSLPAAVQPAARAYAVAARDPIRNQVVLFGGYTAAATYPETWIWDGIAWAQAAPTLVPGAAVSLAFDPVAGRLALAGGSGYEWTGTDWLVRSAIGGGNWRGLVTDHEHGVLLDVQPPIVQVLTAHRAQVQRHGQGCAIGRQPVLAAIDEPALGVDFSVEIGAEVAGAPTFFVVGLGAQNQPLGGGCAQLVANPLAVNFTMANAVAVARQPIPIPNAPSLRGVQFVVQGAVWNPGSSPLGTVVLTDGLIATIGD